jgi:hypothetical protein
MLRHLAAALLTLASAGCSSYPASSASGPARVTVLTAERPRVLGAGEIWGYADGGASSGSWRVVLAKRLDQGDARRAEAVALHELWHVVTLNRRDHSGVPGTVSRGEVGNAPFALEIQPIDLEGAAGRSFVLEGPEGHPVLRAALERAAAQWNRRLGYEAFTWSTR